MNTSHQSIEIKEKKPDNLTHSLIESDFFTCITLLSRRKIKKALINQGFFISRSRQSLS